MWQTKTVCFNVVFRRSEGVHIAQLWKFGPEVGIPHEMTMAFRGRADNAVPLRTLQQWSSQLEQEKTASCLKGRKIIRAPEKTFRDYGVDRCRVRPERERQEETGLSPRRSELHQGVLSTSTFTRPRSFAFSRRMASLSRR